MDGNDSAFPVIDHVDLNPEHISLGEISAHYGLTKRELFAAMAMQGYCSRGESSTEESASWAVYAADCLIKELGKKEKQ